MIQIGQNNSPNTNTVGNKRLTQTRANTNKEGIYKPNLIRYILSKINT